MAVFEVCAKTNVLDSNWIPGTVCWKIIKRSPRNVQSGRQQAKNVAKFALPVVPTVLIRGVSQERRKNRKHARWHTRHSFPVRSSTEGVGGRTDCSCFQVPDAFLANSHRDPVIRVLLAVAHLVRFAFSFCIVEIFQVLLVPVLYVCICLFAVHERTSQSRLPHSASHTELIVNFPPRAPVHC